MPELTLNEPALVTEVRLAKDCVAAEPTFLLKVPLLMKVAEEPFPCSGTADVVSLMMPLLFSVAPLYMVIWVAPPMFTVPLLFQVATPFKLGVPVRVVVPVVVRVPPPTPSKVVAPRLKALSIVTLPAPFKMPPVSESVGPPATKVLFVAKLIVPPVIATTPVPMKVAPLKTCVPAVDDRLAPARMLYVPVSVVLTEGN